MWEHFGFCTGGFILSSFFGLPLILAHLGNLNDLNTTAEPPVLLDTLDVPLLAGWTVANVVMFAGILAFSYIAKANED